MESQTRKLGAAQVQARQFDIAQRNEVAEFLGEPTQRFEPRVVLVSAPTGIGDPGGPHARQGSSRPGPWSLPVAQEPRLLERRPNPSTVAQRADSL